MLNIRETDSLDVDAIQRIEEASFSAPFSRDMFYGMLEGRPFGGFSALEGDDLVGYIFYSIAADQMELITVAVDEKQRRKGVARALIERMLDVARESSVRMVFLEVRTSNEPAQALYRSFDFRDVAVREKYYKDNNEDAVVMGKVMEGYLM